MPELIEVAWMGERLAAVAHGRLLTGGQALDGDVLRDALGRPLAHPVLPDGGGWLGVQRRGKVLLAQWEALALAFHFRMTGLLTDQRGPAARLSLRFGGPSDRAEAMLWLTDPRRLAEVRMGTAEDLGRWLEGLGPEPWPDPLPAAVWAARLTGRTPLKVALMDPQRIAGLGNIAGSEICYRAGIDPRSPCHRLSLIDWQRVSEATAAHLAHTAIGILPFSSQDQLSYVNSGGPNPFLVYGREGQRCPQGERIVRIQQSGRSTFLVPALQPLR